MSKDNIKVLMSSDSVEWETPPELFKKLDKIFKFTLDPCATKKNAKCKKFFTEKQNGLEQSWGGESVFVNPPYGRFVDEWVFKSFEEFSLNNALVVMLLAARPETKRWQDLIFLKAKVICFMKKRVKFWLNGKPHMVKDRKTGKLKNGSPAFPSAIVVFQNKKILKVERLALLELGFVI